MKARSLMAVVIFLVVILFAPQGVGYVLGAQDASADTAGGLNTAAGYNIATEVSAVWGLENNDDEEDYHCHQTFCFHFYYFQLPDHMDFLTGLSSSGLDNCIMYIQTTIKQV